MAKIHARNASVVLSTSAGASAVWSADSNTATLRLSAEAPEIAPFGYNTKQRLTGGLKRWELSVNGYYGIGAAEAKGLMTDMVGASTVMQFGPAGSTTGCPRYSACGIINSFNMSMTTNDAATFTLSVQPFSGSMNRDYWA